MSILGFLFYCLVATLCASVAEYIAPGRIPGGLLIATLFGIIGAWIGSSLMGSFGPGIGGVALIPAIIGSAILIFALSLMSKAKKST